MSTVKKVAILLPFFKLPVKPIKIGNITITKSAFYDLDDKYKISFSAGMSCNFGELKKLLKKRHGEKIKLGESMWTILELEKEESEIPSICYLAILELITKHWEYVLKHNEDFKKPIDIPSITTYKIRTYSLNKTIMDKFKKGINLLRKKHFQIALQRWNTSYNREDALDSVLDCCSALESVISCESELRLRLSLSCYHILRNKKKSSMLNIYKMYGKRNTFVHGSGIPEISKIERNLFITIVADVLSTLIKDQKIPDKTLLGQRIFSDYS